MSGRTLEARSPLLPPRRRVASNPTVLPGFDTVRYPDALPGRRRKQSIRSRACERFLGRQMTVCASLTSEAVSCTLDASRKPDARARHGAVAMRRCSVPGAVGMSTGAGRYAVLSKARVRPRSLGSHAGVDVAG